MTAPYEPPALSKDAFNCPHCRAYADQRSGQMYASYSDSGGFQDMGLYVRTCNRCRKHTLWSPSGNLLHPDQTTAPPANDDLSEDVARDYAEAASIVGRSPRGAAALLRLTLQKMCDELGHKGKSIDQAIAAMVEDGLPRGVQQAMDVLRVIGNNAVHPGQVDLRDDAATALSLFGLVNLVAERMISEPKRIEEMYENLPPGARAAIEKRDAPKS